MPSTTCQENCIIDATNFIFGYTCQNVVKKCSGTTHHGNCSMMQQNFITVYIFKKVVKIGKVPSIMKIVLLMQKNAIFENMCKKQCKKYCETTRDDI